MYVKQLPAEVVASLPDWLIIDAVRYAVGRCSTQPAETAAWLVAHWRHIPATTQAIIRRDLEEAFRDDDDARARGSEYKRLGWDCDRQTWETVRALWADPQTGKTTFVYGRETP